jgi:hypothetical protein
MGASLWPNKENYSKLNKDQAKFIFDQAEKQLKETSDAGNLVVTRATTVITLLSGLAIGLIGFSLNRWQTTRLFDNLLFATIITIGYLFTIIILLVWNIMGKNYSIQGAEPKSLFVDGFFATKNDEERTIRFYVNEFVNYQTAIESNKNTNEQRWKWFNRSLILLIISPFVILLTYYLIDHYRP